MHNKLDGEVDRQKRIDRSLLQQKILASKAFSVLRKIIPSIIFNIKDTAIDNDRGVAVWNRSSETVIARLFIDENNPEYNAYFATREGVDLPIPHQVIELENPIGGLEHFFGKGENLLELGCGGGEAAVGFAKLNTKLNVIGADRAFGDSIPLRRSRLSNLRFEKVDWNNMPYEDGTFDRIISDQGAAYYYSSELTAREISRVSMMGCVFRGSKDTGVIGLKGFLEDLCDNGWDVYTPVADPNKFVAIFKGSEYKASKPRPPRHFLDNIGVGNIISGSDFVFNDDENMDSEFDKFR